jgi:hypothetical protein
VDYYEETPAGQATVSAAAAISTSSGSMCGAVNAAAATVTVATLHGTPRQDGVRIRQNVEL